MIGADDRIRHTFCRFSISASLLFLSHFTPIISETLSGRLTGSAVFLVLFLGGGRPDPGKTRLISHHHLIESTLNVQVTGCSFDFFVVVVAHNTVQTCCPLESPLTGLLNTLISGM